MTNAEDPLQADVSQSRPDPNLQRHSLGSIAANVVSGLDEAEDHPRCDPSTENTEDSFRSSRMHSLHSGDVTKEDLFAGACGQGQSKTIGLDPTQTTQLPGLVVERDAQQFLLLELLQLASNLLVGIRNLLGAG